MNISECICREEETNTVPGIFIFKANHMMSGDHLRLLRNDLLDQMKRGIVLLPPYIDFICAISKDCEIKIVNKDGSVVEIEKGD